MHFQIVLADAKDSGIDVKIKGNLISFSKKDTLTMVRRHGREWVAYDANGRVRFTGGKGKVAAWCVMMLKEG